MTKNELYHYGIKGQKWGVRRYQNIDGSLTSEGKKRYTDGEVRNSNSNQYIAKGIKDLSEEDLNTLINESYNITNSSQRATNTIKKLKTKQVDETKQMSNEELARKVNRMQLEKNYTELKAETNKRGKDVVNAIFNITKDTLSIAGSALAIAYVIKKLTR